MPRPTKGCAECRVKKRICRACTDKAAEHPIAVEPPIQLPVETKRPKRNVPPRATFEDQHHNRDAHRLWDWRHPGQIRRPSPSSTLPVKSQKTASSSSASSIRSFFKPPAEVQMKNDINAAMRPLLPSDSADHILKEIDSVVGSFARRVNDAESAETRAQKEASKSKSTLTQIAQNMDKLAEMSPMLSGLDPRGTVATPSS